MVLNYCGFKKEYHTKDTIILLKNLLLINPYMFIAGHNISIHVTFQPTVIGVEGELGGLHLFELPRFSD